jgi:two-component system KDP operon response regulator KdpE
MPEAAHILVVDDDPGLRKLISSALQSRGYRVSTASDGDEALRELENDVPDLIILDLMMPRVDGLEVCRQVRQRSALPIMVLSGVGDEARKVQALDLGADDYLTKPFGVPELTARIRAVLRRAGVEGKPSTNEALFQQGNLVVDLTARQVRVAEREVRLTPTEFSILAELVRNAGRVLTHDMLLSRVWGAEYRGSSQYLHIYIGRLRNKLAGLQGVEIVTEQGVGYWLRA